MNPTPSKKPDRLAVNHLCPPARKSASVRKTDDGRTVIDTTTYIPYFLVSVNNPLSRGASLLYLEKFGIGIVEWRVISMLAAEPGIPASRICSVISLDKGATSRALTRLQELGYTRFKASPTDPRKRIWWLNKEGYALHDRLIEIALERERKLIAGADPDDLEAFLRVMRIMRCNVENF
jgi:DNA-binding MarR family transcriptional regulator